jgi:hypothetical protein
MSRGRRPGLVLLQKVTNRALNRAWPTRDIDPGSGSARDWRLASCEKWRLVGTLGQTCGGDRRGAAESQRAVCSECLRLVKEGRVFERKAD